MPDLPDELRALLRDRADDAPAVPAPTAALVRTVRRRQALRTSLAVGGATLGVVAIVAVAVAAVRPTTSVAPPAANPTTPFYDKYEFCTGPVTQDIVVSAHPTELKFQYGCYRVTLGAQRVTFVNPQQLAHNVAVAREGEQVPFWAGDIVTGGHTGGLLPAPLQPGDYTLFCQVHPAMRAQLIVRKP